MAERVLEEVNRIAAEMASGQLDEKELRRRALLICSVIDEYNEGKAKA